MTTAALDTTAAKARPVNRSGLMILALGRLGEVEDVTGVLVFLASSAAGFVTGQTIYVDGGYTAG